MFERLIQPLKRELSGTRAFQHVDQVASHHRIQASPGFRAAAEYTRQALSSAGLLTEILSYTANYKSQFLSQLMWQEWSCEGATLKLVHTDGSTTTLADYDDCKISLIQRSVSTAPGGVTAEVLVLDKGDDEEFYPEVDLRGKLVLTDGDLGKVRKWAVEKRGAIGIISDRLAEVHPIRHRFDIPDARQYTSFWWTGQEKQCFGFVLSPKLGDSLRRTAAKMAADHAKDPAKPAAPLVHAEVKSSLYDGFIENVSAVIPGVIDEEILIVAHLCHPQPSANDNASGVGVAMEVARSLQKLVATGELAKPYRTIRFLLVPEMSGTYAYLATQAEIAARTLAAVNLDMVGQRQDLCKGPLVVEYPPVASRSFVGDLLAEITGDVAQEAKNLAGTAAYGLFMHTTSPFSGGSDHYILSDPAVNIPCPMLIQWPDKYYHTSEDTIDKVDPEMLYRVGVITGVYAYYLANMGATEAASVANLSCTRFSEEVSRLVSSYLFTISQEISSAQEQTCKLRKALDFTLENRKAQLMSLGRFAKNNCSLNLEEPAKHLEAVVDLEWARFTQGLKALGATYQASETQLDRTPGEELVPVKTYPGPISLRGHVERLNASEQEQFNRLGEQFGREAQRLATPALYWADGARTIGEISSILELEQGYTNTAYLIAYMQSLAAMGLVTFK